MRRSSFTLLALVLLVRSLAQVDLVSDLKVCLPFSGNTNDYSGNGNHGILSGGVALTSDRFNMPNSAYNFVGGANDYIALNNFDQIIPDHQLTIAMWAKVKVQTSTCLFILNPDNAWDRCVGCAQYSGVGLVWDYGDIFNNGRVTQSQSFDTLWHHYAFICDGAASVKYVYVDGVLAATHVTSETIGNKRFPLYIGAGTSDIGRGSLRWRGKIDDVLIYNRALNGTEVAVLSTGSGKLNLCNITTNLADSHSAHRYYFYPSVSSDGHFSFAGDAHGLEQVIVTGIDGKTLKVYDGRSIREEQVLDLSGLVRGCYLIKKVFQGQETAVQRVFITN